MAIETEVMTYLKAQLPTKTIKIDRFGPTPNDMIVVSREPNGRVTIRSGVVHNAIKVSTRAENIVNAKADSLSVYNALHNKTGILTSPTQLVKALNSPFLIGQDENDRYIYSNDFIVRSIGF